MLLLAEVLKYILPSLIVLVAVYYIFKMYLNKQSEKAHLELRFDAQKVSMPIRMQAYERLVLLVERMDLSSLVARLFVPGMNVATLQGELLQNIRGEFDHNLSQQLYVSSRAWELVRNTREETVKRINTVAMEFKPDAPAAEFVNQLLMNDFDKENSIAKSALEQIKLEARNNFC